MTVREWIERRPTQGPASLTQQVIAMLGADAGADESRAAEVCLSAASRALESLLEERRFAREHAADLLAIDALTTYAFEHASTRRDAGELAVLSEQGARLFGQLMAQRV